MKIAIVGSRRCDAKGAVEYFIGSVAAKAPDTTIVSGGAHGVDSWAYWAAKQAGLKVEVYLADWDTHGKAAGFIRNTIKKARGAGKLAKVFMVNALLNPI